MALETLYHLTQHEIDKLHEDMATHFLDDDLYRTVFTDDKKRERVLRYFFRHYLKCIASNCHFVADSKELNSVMVVYDSSLEDPLLYHIRLLWMNIKMLPLLGMLGSWKNVLHVLSCWDMFTSRWTKNFIHGFSFHADLIFTREQCRGQGLATTMLQALREEANQRHWDITMETHHEDNIPLYKRCGFAIMLEITHEEYQLKQYCLLQRNSEVQL